MQSKGYDSCPVCVWGCGCGWVWVHVGGGGGGWVRVCVCGCVCVCVSVCLSVRSFLPPRACRSQNIGTNGFIAMQENFFNCGFC